MAAVAQNAPKIACTSHGNHSNDERQTIVAAIQYTLAQNNGQTNADRIRLRLINQGFSKILIMQGAIAEDKTSFEPENCKQSTWRVNGTDYEIWTDLVLE